MPKRKPGNEPTIQEVRFWEAKPRRGRKFKYTNPEQLLQDCTEYFEWCQNNPLMEAKIVNTKDGPSIEYLPRMRVFTMMGLFTFLGITTETWISQWAKPGHYLSEVALLVEGIVRNHKFTGAAAFMLQPNLIARDLGLADRQEVTSPDGSMGTKVAVVLPGVPGTLSMEEWTKAYNAMQLQKAESKILDSGHGEQRALSERTQS